MQKDYLAGEKISSIYLGGGTPSVLDAGEVRMLLEKIHCIFDVDRNAEITLEANPDDLFPGYLSDLQHAGINRLSLGVQSFFGEDLTRMNRRHDAAASASCIENSISAGFTNINVDLIYGLPGMDDAKWKRNLGIFFGTGVNHLSAYHLTLEEKTVYSHRVKKGMLKPPGEKKGARQFEMLMDMASDEGFIHYEISNFCRPGHFSRHNTGYWLQHHYLGIGPSANSYNGISRQWNVRNNTLYIKSIKSGKIPFEYEELDKTTRYNEYILTSLRTMWGADPSYVERIFGEEYAGYFLKEADMLTGKGFIERRNGNIVLTREGRKLADGIISGLFREKE